MADLEGLELLDAGETGGFEDCTGGRSLQGESRNLRGDLAHLDLEADGRIEQPVDLTLRRAQPILALAEREDRAVVQQVPGIVAPDAIGHASGLELAQIAGHESVEVLERLRTADPVLHHRREVVEGGGIADCEIFLLDGREDIDRRVARPGDEALDLAQAPGALVKRGLEERLLKMRERRGAAHAAVLLRISRAALRPAVPMTPPPGWQPAPHRYSPGSGVRCWVAPGTGRTMKN